MAENVEIKARIENFETVKKKAQQLSGGSPVLLEQEDTFFNIPKGRLKLRIQSPNEGQLIFYDRPDESGPKTSFYLITKTTDPDSLKAVLASSLGIRGTVKKQRWLYLVDNTRIHLDQVEGLGSFLELEVVMEPNQSFESGYQTAMVFIKDLGIPPHALIKGAYIDLLEQTS